MRPLLVLRVAYLLTDAAPQRRPCVDPLHSFPLLRPAVLTFGYYDASTLIYWLKGFGAVFQDAFEKEFMYLHTRLDRVPTVNVLCAVLSIINMNFVIRRDFVGTLRSCILGFKTHRHIREGEPPVRAALHSWLNVFLPVYCGITVRAILLPAYTACAAPLAFRGATAADIVLSSMSLSFLFDLDDMLYGYLLSSRQRGIYKGVSPCWGLAMSTPRWGLVMSTRAGPLPCHPGATGGGGRCMQCAGRRAAWAVDPCQKEGISLAGWAGAPALGCARILCAISHKALPLTHTARTLTPPPFGRFPGGRYVS